MTAITSNQNYIISNGISPDNNYLTATNPVTTGPQNLNMINWELINAGPNEYKIQTNNGSTIFYMHLHDNNQIMLGTLEDATSWNIIGNEGEMITITVNVLGMHLFLQSDGNGIPLAVKQPSNGNNQKWKFVRKGIG